MYKISRPESWGKTAVEYESILDTLEFTGIFYVKKQADGYLFSGGDDDCNQVVLTPFQVEVLIAELQAL